MTARLNHLQLLDRDEIVSPPQAPARACTDHSFELPTGIYKAMACLFGGTIAVLAFSFSARLAVSYGVIFAFLAAFFAVPTLMVKASRGEGTKPLAWHAFLDHGIDTLTGRTRAADAITLVLILPALIFTWAVAVAIIATVIR